MYLTFFYFYLINNYTNFSFFTLNTQPTYVWQSPSNPPLVHIKVIDNNHTWSGHPSSGPDSFQSPNWTFDSTVTICYFFEISISFYTPTITTSVLGIPTYSTVFKPIPCILRGMTILTPKGNVLVENLKENDIVISRRGSVRITRILRTTTIGTIHSLPCCIAKSTCGANIPNKDIFLSRDHKFVFQNKWVTPIEAGFPFVQEYLDKNIEYSCRDIENKDMLHCHGLWIDSWHP
jgi:hypothetical protein